MSQAEAYLNSLTDDVPHHDHTVTDSDSHFVIDPETRKISSTGQTENVLIQYDHNSEVYTFELPRYIDGHDMTLCNRVRVHYNNVDGKTNRAIPDVAEMTDLHVSETDSEKVVSSWLISRNATQLAGTLNFLIQYMCVADDDTVVYEWHTDIYDGVYVNSGRRNNKQAVSRYSDVLEQWYQRLFGTGESVMALAEEKIEAITEVGNSKVGEVITEANEQIAIAKEEIESKASAALDSIPSEYTELYGYANEAARTKGDAVTHTVAGETLSVSDSSDDYLRGLRVFGKTTQVKTTGKNLLHSTAETGSINGINYSIHKDGSVLVNGTATDDSFLTIGSISYIGGVTYKISGCPRNGSNNTYMLYAVYGTNVYAFDTGAGITFTPETDMVKTVSIKIVKGTTVTNLAFYPMVRYASTGDDTYEPYSGGVASPSPEWPQELTSIENPVVDVYGKNLLKHTVSPGSHTIKGITFTVRDDGSVVCNGTATAPATLSFERCYLTEDIIVSGCPAGGDTQTYRITVDAYKNDSYVRSEFDLGNSVTIRKASYDYVNINIFFYAGTVADNMVFYPMVRHASITDATYEPYNGGSVTITHTLPGIPVSQNGNYTDADGQQWVCDEVDFERGVYVQRVKSVTLIGDTISVGIYGQNGTAFTISKATIDIAVTKDSAYKSPILCDIFTSATIQDVYGNVVDNSICGSTSGTVLRVNVRACAGYTATEFKQWLIGKRPTFAYALETPIETPLTETELQAFRHTHSNYPNTTVLNDSGAHMELKYNVDTELFIKNTVPRPSDEQVNDIVMPWFEENSELLRGPQGPKGDTGATGATGPQGPKGADGTMTFSDLTQEQKDSLKGADGPQGPQGPKGDPGVYVGSTEPTDNSVTIWIDPNGEAGKLKDGKSAYEYAKEAGYTGTEEEFAEHLATGGKSAYEYAKEAGYTGTEEEFAEQIANGGASGKSAYEYAKEAGFTGTEEEFAEQLANGGSGDLTVDVTNAIHADPNPVDADTLGGKFPTQFGDVTVDMTGATAGDSNYVKPQSPMYSKENQTYFYPLTTSDQVILPDGSRLNSENLRSYGYKRNLLDNSDFTNPVNQRGETTYTVTQDYTIDRWAVYNGTLTVFDDFVTISGMMYQLIEGLDLDKTYTLAAYNANGISVVSGKFTDNVTADSPQLKLMLTTYSGLAEVCLFNADGVEVGGAFWVALYEGEYAVETLPAYQPKGYGAELLECQRYFVNVSGIGVGSAHAYDTANYYGFVPTPVRMRIVPTITYNYIRVGNGVYSDSFTDSSSVTSATVNNNGICFWAKASGLTAGKSYILHPSKMHLSADL